MIIIENKQTIEKQMPTRFSRIKWINDNPVKLKEFSDIWLVGCMIPNEKFTRIEEIVIQEPNEIKDNKKYTALTLYQIRKFRLLSPKDLENAKQRTT